jgi:glyoxylase-like metal-dependent hydrolase (beta-lactamase superfamily II)
MHSEVDLVEVQPGLLRFRVPFPNDPKRHVNSYLFVAQRQALLIDASWNLPEARAALDAALEQSGLEPRSLKYVLITHLHPDHIGLAAELRKSGARIGYHPSEMLLRSRFHHMNDFREHARMFEQLNGAPADNAESSFSIIGAVADTLAEVPRPDLALLGEERIEIGPFRIRAVWTPGHTLGHLCYYEETRDLLFTGDHVLPTITPHVGLYVHVASNPLPNYLDSLRLLKQLRPSLTIPAHGEPFEDLHGRLDELIEHHHERMEELYALVSDEPVTGWQVASAARWTRRKVSLDQVSPQHHRLALAETLAHLELLRAENRLEKVFLPGAMCYRRPSS